MLRLSGAVSTPGSKLSGPECGENTIGAGDWFTQLSVSWKPPSRAASTLSGQNYNCKKMVTALPKLTRLARGTV